MHNCLCKPQNVVGKKESHWLLNMDDHTWIRGCTVGHTYIHIHA